MQRLHKPKNTEKQLVGLGRTLQTLREEDNLVVLIETTINYIKAEFDYSLIWIGLYDRMSHELLGKGGAIPSEGKNGASGDPGSAARTSRDLPKDRNLLNQTFTLTPGDLLEQVVIQQRPVGVPDLREEKRAGEWRKIANKFGIQGTMIFPLRYRALCFGLVILGSELWGISPRSEEKARLSMIFGELAASLSQIEANWHRQQAKHPDKPLLELLAKLRALRDLRQRLEAIVSQTHEFIGPSKTNIYWYHRDRRYFWRRASNKSLKQGLAGPDQSSGITVQEVSSFYKALAADQLVSIGEAHSSLKADTTSRLMQQIKARSLLAAPIIYQNQLLGFIATEGNEARIWEEAEKSYLRGAAQLVALIAPLEEMEATVSRTKQDQALTAEIVHAIYTEADWKETLNNCARLLCDRLEVERFLVLLYNRDRKQFDIVCQCQPGNRRPLATPLAAPSEVDWKLLEKGETAVAIENWDEDVKLIAWREMFLELGVRSLLVCNTAIGHPIEGLLAIAHEVPRTWDPSDVELLRVVSQQIGLIIHQWQLHRTGVQQQKIHSHIQWSLTAMQQIDRLEVLEQEATQQIVQVLQVPLAILITWSLKQDINVTGSPTLGRIAASAVGQASRLPGDNSEFTINPEVQIPTTDPLIQSALSQDGLLQLHVDQLSRETRTWLRAPGIGQMLAISLRTAPEHEPTGMVLVADYSGRHWGEQYLDAFGVLVRQLAWSRRTLALTSNFQSQREELKLINWYKQRRTEEIYRSCGAEVKKIYNLGLPKDALTLTRYQQGLRQLSNTMGSLTSMLKHEQWQLQYNSGKIPLVSLLKRALERVDRLIKQRQLWSQVHGDTGVSIAGDIVKVELVLSELLAIACQRSVAGGRIDIWSAFGESADAPHKGPNSQSQINNSRLLELSFTYAGVLDPRLISELQSSRLDLLAPSTLDLPPGLNLIICQSLMRRMGGDLNIYQLEDGRLLSRLLLPIPNG